jgi:hypothetical protein
LNTKSNDSTAAQFAQVNEVEEVTPAERTAAKKAFVEPEVSFPVDVLEATTFFQLTDSGSTT